MELRIGLIMNLDWAQTKEKQQHSSGMVWFALGNLDSAARTKAENRLLAVAIP